MNRYTKKEDLLSMQTLLFLSYSFSFSTLQHAFCLCWISCNCITAMYKQSCNCVLPIAISCGPAPDAPANGQRIGSGRTFKSTVTYTCNRGYTLQGDNTRTCMANKLWSGRTPTCNRKLLTIRCTTLDIHGHQQSIGAMILQCDASWGFYRHRANKHQVEWQ